MKCLFEGGTNITNKDKQKLKQIKGKIRGWRKQGYNVDELDQMVKSVDQQKENKTIKIEETEQRKKINRKVKIIIPIVLLVIVSLAFFVYMTFFFPKITIYSIDASTYGGTAPLTVSFVGSVSLSAGATDVNFYWDFGDGSNSNDSVITQHTYNNAGIYTARLTITDNLEKTVTKTVTITVSQTKENKIVVGTSSDFPPFEYKAQNGTLIGFDIDLIKKIITDQGFTVEVQDMEFDSLILALQTGNIDVIAAGMAITNERKQQVDFTNPYYNANQAVLVKVGADVHITNINDLVNYSVGAQAGTTGWAWIDDILIKTGKITQAKFRTYDLYTDAVADLIIEPSRVGAIVIDSSVAQAFIKSGNVKIVLNITTNESYGFAVEKGNTALVNKINLGLTNVTATTYWEQLIEKYFTT